MAEDTAENISEQEFLCTAKAYNEKASPMHSTFVSCISSFVSTKCMENALVNLLIMTLDKTRVSNINREGYSIWCITEYDFISGLFTIIEQKAMNPRIVKITIHQLRETSILKLSKVKSIILALETANWVGNFSNFDELCGLDLETIDKEGAHVYNVRKISEGHQLVASFAVKSDAKKEGITETSYNQGQSSTRQTIAQVAYSDSIMAITEKQHGKLNVLNVVYSASRGCQLGEPPIPGNVVLDLSCSLSYADMLSLLNFIIPDIQCFRPCHKLEMEASAKDKTKVGEVGPLLSSAEVSVCMKRAIHLMIRLFGIHQRIVSRWIAVANSLTDFELENREEYPRFGMNGSAAILVNEMISHFSAALTNKDSTVSSIELAIENFDMNINKPWIARRLRAIQTNEVSDLLSVQQSMKRARLTEKVIGLEPSKFQLGVSQHQQKLGSKIVKAKNLLSAGNKATIITSTAQVSNLNVKFGGICRSNCSLEGCVRDKCRFEHVKGIRSLSTAEKMHIKQMISTHNTNAVKTGFPVLTEDPSVLG
jgi:hypothetical protein